MPHTPETGAPGQQLRRLNQLICELDSLYHEASLRLGLSDSVCRILYTICGQGDSCPLHEICRQTGLSKQTVNSALRRLEAEGQIRLEPMDGKAKRVCLTASGQALAARTAWRLILLENALLESWTEEDREQYLTLTQRFMLDFKDRLPNL